MRLTMRFALGVALCGGMFAGSPGWCQEKPGDQPCDGHPDAKKKWDIQKGQSIFVSAVFTAGGKSKAIYPDTKPIDWGKVKGRQIRFRVDAHDRDDHVCKLPQSPVLNLIQPSALKVTVHQGTPTGPVVKTIDLTTTTEPRVQRRWTGSWEIPQNLVGQVLVFLYEGRVDDVTCSTHTSSDDDAIDLTTGSYMTAVKINGGPEAWKKATGQFDFADPKTVVPIQGTLYSPPNGYSGLKPKNLRDWDKNANGQPAQDTFNGPAPVKWTGWNSVFTPVAGTPATSFTWTGPGPDKAEADVIMNLNDDGAIAEDGGYQGVASVKIVLLRVDTIKFQKSTMAPNWKTVDQVYKHLGVFTGQSATFGVNTTPSGITLPNGLLTWGGLASGTTPEVSVTFSAPNFLEAVTVTCGGTTKSALVAIRDQPSGMGETAYAALHAVYTAIAMANNLIGTDVTTLEPFIWANSAYPGIQHNTVADAVRHAYWTCLLTRYTVAGYAEGLTTQHEVSSPGPSTETVMDLHNNLMGISIEGDHTHTSGLGCCRTAVQSAVSAGTLWYLDSSYGAVNTTEDALLQPTNK